MNKKGGIFMCTIASVLLVNYIFRHEVDNWSDYLNNREALICTIGLTMVFEVATRCNFFKKKQ